MAALSVMIAFMIRMVLVLLFFPFSALDKMLNFNGAVAQAEESIPTRKLAVAAICAGLFIEIVMSLCILTGFADRAAAFVLAGYCGLTEAGRFLDVQYGQSAKPVLGLS